MEPKMATLKDVLYEIHKKLTRVEFNDLKHLCKKFLSPKKLEECKDTYEVLEALQQNGAFTEENLTPLKELMTSLERRDLEILVLNYSFKLYQPKPNSFFSLSLGEKIIVQRMPQHIEKNFNILHAAFNIMTYLRKSYLAESCRFNEDESDLKLDTHRLFLDTASGCCLNLDPSKKTLSSELCGSGDRVIISAKHKCTADYISSKWAKNEINGLDKILLKLDLSNIPPGSSLKDAIWTQLFKNFSEFICKEEMWKWIECNQQHLLFLLDKFDPDDMGSLKSLDVLELMIGKILSKSSVALVTLAGAQLQFNDSSSSTCRGEISNHFTSRKRKKVSC